MIDAAEASLEGQSTPTVEEILFYAKKHRDGYFLLLACATLLVYDYFLTVEEEWTFVWRQGPRMSATKLLFGLNRYYPVITYLVRVYVFSNTVLTKTICDVGLGFTSWSTVINFATVEIVLLTRIWALYDHSKRMAVLLSTIFILALSTSLVIRYIKPTTVKLHLVAPTPQSLTQCKRSPPQELFFQYLIGLVCETIIFSLLIRKAWTASMGARVTPILNTLLTSGVLYYAIIFVAFLLMIIATAVPAMYTPIADANPAIAIASVACSRLVLSLRIKFYRLESDTTHHGVTIKTKDIDLGDLSSSRRRHPPGHSGGESTFAIYTIDEENGRTIDTRDEG